MGQTFERHSSRELMVMVPMAPVFSNSKWRKHSGQLWSWPPIRFVFPAGTRPSFALIVNDSFASRVTGGAFIAAAMMLWFGWFLLPVKIGRFFDPAVFPRH